MTSQEEMPDLCNMDKYILHWLLKKMPQDKIWLDTFKDRLRKLERRKLVKKNGNLWSLIASGMLSALIQEGKMP